MKKRKRVRPLIIVPYDLNGPTIKIYICIGAMKRRCRKKKTRGGWEGVGVNGFKMIFFIIMTYLHLSSLLECA